MNGEHVETQCDRSTDPKIARAALRMIDKALRAAGKKLPLKSESAREKMLEFAAMNMAEAYQIGAEEAQGEILRRLHDIRRALSPPSSVPAPVGHLEVQREKDAETDYRRSMR